MRELLDDVRLASRQHALLRALIPTCLVLFAVALLMVGDTSVWALLVLGVLGTACAVNPHGALPAVVLLYVVVVWAVGVQLTWTLWTLVAALSLLVFHTACALAAALPAPAPVPAALWHRYAVRLLLVGLVTAVMWLLALVQQALRVPGGVLAAVTGLLVLGAALALHYVLLTRRSP